jgi:hypothetical protein
MVFRTLHECRLREDVQESGRRAAEVLITASWLLAPNFRGMLLETIVNGSFISKLMTPIDLSMC